MNEVNNGYFLEDFVDGDIVINVMKKFLSEVFGSIFEKVWRYLENFLSLLLFLKCLLFSVSGLNFLIVFGIFLFFLVMYDLNIFE